MAYLSVGIEYREFNIITTVLYDLSLVNVQFHQPIEIAVLTIFHFHYVFKFAPVVLRHRTCNDQYSFYLFGKIVTSIP
jgi:hypothetical protein